MDDYFIFYNDDDVCKDIVNNLRFCLKKYKLTLNTGKLELKRARFLLNLKNLKYNIKQLFPKGM
jgi:hypothetical protein